MLKKKTLENALYHYAQHLISELRKEDKPSYLGKFAKEEARGLLKLAKEHDIKHEFSGYVPFEILNREAILYFPNIK